MAKEIDCHFTGPALGEGCEHFATAQEALKYVPALRQHRQSGKNKSVLEIFSEQNDNTIKVDGSENESTDRNNLTIEAVRHVVGDELDAVGCGEMEESDTLPDADDDLSTPTRGAG